MSAADKGTYVVMKQPMSLDRLSLHDVSQTDATGNKDIRSIVSQSFMKQKLSFCHILLPDFLIFNI